MRRLLLIGSALMLLSACSDPQGAQETLKGAGYTSVQTGGHGWLSRCADSDEFQTHFKAKGPSGWPVSGVVCRGWFKGSP